LGLRFPDLFSGWFMSSIFSKTNDDQNENKRIEQQVLYYCNKR